MTKMKRKMTISPHQAATKMKKVALLPKAYSHTSRVESHLIEKEEPNGDLR